MKTDGEVVGYNKFSSKKEERKQLFKLLRRLLAEGVSKNNIVILSTFRMNNERSCLFDCVIPPEIGEIRQNEFNDLKSDKFIRFYTVQSFKGLEAQVIVYIDIIGFKTDEERMINYVAMSRARTLLEIFYEESLEEERQQMMINTLIPGENRI